MLSFLLAHSAALALIAVAAFGAGSLVLPPLRFHSPLEQVVTGTTLGLGVIGTLLFLLGLAGGLSWWPVVLTLGGAATWGLRCAGPLVAAAFREGWERRRTRRR